MTLHKTVTVIEFSTMSGSHDDRGFPELPNQDPHGAPRPSTLVDG